MQGRVGRQAVADQSAPGIAHLPPPVRRTFSPCIDPEILTALSTNWAPLSSTLTTLAVRPQRATHTKATVGTHNADPSKASDVEGSRH